MRRDRGNAGGFTLIEMMIAIVVLTVGMLALAAFLSQMDKTSNRSRLMSTAALLASEKLEELNRFPLSDPNLKVVTGTTAGSLTDDSDPVIIGSVPVSYHDTVAYSTGGGTVSESKSGVDASGNATVSTISLDADGKLSTGVAAQASDALVFHRRWLIEKDPSGLPAAAGDFQMYRFTVLVALANTSARESVTFQMSMIRQVAQ
jgi:prepilin-type N-terminal cleavage/methylation domain-containing protein